MKGSACPALLVVSEILVRRYAARLRDDER